MAVMSGHNGCMCLLLYLLKSVGHAVDDVRNANKILLRKFGRKRPLGGEY
jgi:hypothetical protein